MAAGVMMLCGHKDTIKTDVLSGGKVGLRGATAKYATRLSSALSLSEVDIPELLSQVCPACAAIKVRLTPIAGNTLDYWERVWLPNQTNGPGGWNWKVERGRFDNEPTRFDVAVWGNEELCGLAIGKLNASKAFLNMHLLEGSPVSGHPLKGAIRHCVIDAAIRYADINGCSELRLMRPLDGAVPLYENMGFLLQGLEANPPYCSIRVS